MTDATNTAPEARSKPILSQEIAFGIVHLLPLGALFTGATFFDWMVCLFLYVYRMFWITGGYHRYFAHKSYKTSRFFQFIIAFMAQTSAQREHCGGLHITVIIIVTVIRHRILTL